MKIRKRNAQKTSIKGDKYLMGGGFDNSHEMSTDVDHRRSPKNEEGIEGQEEQGDHENETQKKDTGVLGTSGAHGGILKSSQMDHILPPNESQLLSSLPLPKHMITPPDVAEGNNTTSRISTMISQSNMKDNRRVSFAPDVTLHSFEFVPERKSVWREPRRRTYDTVVTSTQNDSNADPHVSDSSLMDLTEPMAIGATQSGRPEGENYTPVFSQEDSMDITQLFSKHSKNTSGENTMDLTSVHDSAISPSKESGTMEFTAINLPESQSNENEMSFTTVNKLPNTKKTTEENNTPPPVQRKKRKLDEDNEDVNSAGSLKSQLIENHDGEEDMELTLNERMSPIKLSALDPEVGSVPQKETQQSYSLEHFLEQTGSTFLIDSDLTEHRNSRITFQLIDFDKMKKFRINQIYSTLYFETPILEMNAFICKELLRKISQSKLQFEDVNKQISTSVPPPLLFSEYFHSSEEMKQLINQQIHLVRSYSKLEAKKLWYEWRIQHFSGIKTVLLENLQILNEELNKLRKDLDRMQEIKNRAEHLRDSIRREICLLRELPADVYEIETKLTEKMKLAELRQELKSEQIAISDSKPVADQYHIIKGRISEITLKLMHIKNEITEMHHKRLNVSQKSKYTQYHVNRLRSVIEVLGTMSGFEFIKLHNADLSFRVSELKPPLELTFHLDALRTEHDNILNVEGCYAKDKFFTHLFTFQKTSPEIVQSTDIPLDIFKYVRKSIPLIKQYHLLKMLFPVQFVTRDNGKYISLQIEDCDIKSESIVFYNLPVKDFFTAVTDSKSKFFLTASAKLIPRSSFPNLTIRFFKKATKVLPWLHQDRCEISFNET